MLVFKYEKAQAKHTGLMKWMVMSLIWKLSLWPNTMFRVLLWVIKWAHNAVSLTLLACLVLNVQQAFNIPYLKAETWLIDSKVNHQKRHSRLPLINLNLHNVTTYNCGSPMCIVFIVDCFSIALFGFVLLLLNFHLSSEMKHLVLLSAALWFAPTLLVLNL